MDDARIGELESLAVEVRKDVVRMVGVARSYGLASALTVVDLLVYLYWERMNISAQDRARRDRDRLVLSKGAAAPALYACLARLGFFNREELWSYRRLGAMLQGCPDIRTPGVDAPSGAHGGGIGIASGLCFAMRMDGIGSRVYCVMGDGELQEGVVWESLFAASSHRLGNLILLVDANGHMDDGPLAGLKETGALAEKFKAFGWHVTNADGHDFVSLEQAFETAAGGRDMPKVILARTCTGSGVSFLEQSDLGNVRPLSSEDMDRALSLLEATEMKKTKDAESGQ